MDVKKIIAVIVAIALAAVLFILIRSDRGDTPASAATAAPTAVPASEEPDATEAAPRYHIAVLSNSELEHYPLVRIDLDGLEVPVYACTDEAGEVRFYVYGFEETTGQYGFLPAYPEYPAVRVDNSEGFAEFPRLAKGLTAGESAYDELAFASINGGPAQMYYPIDGDGNMRDGAIPVSVEEVNRIFGAYFVFDEAHKALICPLDRQAATAEPTETEQPTVEPAATPAIATPVTAASATPTRRPTPRPTQRPSGNPTTNPSATPTVRPSASPTAQPSTAPTAAPSSGGHWELTWVIDQPEVKHREWHCHVCGKVFLDEDSCKADQNAHKQNEGVTGWHVEWVIDQEEVGHYEPIWVPDP